MSIYSNAIHRAAFLARIVRIKQEIADLGHEIDIAFQTRPVPPAPDLRLLGECDTHLHLALVELDEAADRIRNLP